MAGIDLFCFLVVRAVTVSVLLVPIVRSLLLTAPALRSPLRNISYRNRGKAALHRRLALMDDIEDCVSSAIDSPHGTTSEQAPMYIFPTSVTSAIRPALLQWYRENRRRLPWRGDTVDVAAYLSGEGKPFKLEFDGPDCSIPMSAYGTWVSEIMLQQTRIETVIPYWLRWMKAYPTVDALASANIDDINKLWAGLGYYRRARQLLEGARKVVSDFGSVVPSTVPELLSIPGIGPYTAGAIASIAYGRPEPLVDGNVIRVFSRLLAIPVENGDKLNKVCWTAARSLVDPEDPSSFNQALMELGATVCKPTSPNCQACPLSNQCKAFGMFSRGEEIKGLDGKSLKLESISDLPLKAPKKPPKELKYHVHIVRRHRDGRSEFMLVRRPSTGLLAGQWEFPMVPAAGAIPLKEEGGGASKDDEEGANCESVSGTDLEYSDAMHEFFNSTLRINTIASGGKPSGTHVYQETMKIESSTILDIDNPIVHIFSHQKHVMIPVFHDTHFDGAEAAASAGAGAGDTAREREVRWLALEEFDSVGITSGVKKVKVLLERRLASVAQGGDNIGSGASTAKRSSGAGATGKASAANSKKRPAPAAAPISNYFNKAKKEA